MICINCFHVKTRVTNSRPHKTNPATWRRRNCPRCGTIFTSYERPSLDDRPVLGHNNQATPFSVSKLTISISRSFQHHKPTADYQSMYLAQTVETKLLLRQKEISVDDITAITHETLKQFDPIAALQYAAQHQFITLTRRPGRPSITFSDDLSAQS